VRISRIAASILLVTAAAGCGGGSSAGGKPAVVTSTAVGASGTASIPPPSAVATPIPATGTLVEFGRQGGLAGLDDQVTVQADGTYQIVRKGGTGTPTPGRLSPDEVAKLRAVLDSAHFGEIPAVNPGSSAVADGFTYRVAYAGHEVLAQDGGVPPALAPVLDALSGILSR
jgi:hypothetical protein